MHNDGDAFIPQFRLIPAAEIVTKTVTKDVQKLSF